MFAQIFTFFGNFFSKYGKAIVLNTVSFSNVRKMEKSVDKGKTFGELLTDLSKELYCLDHEFLTAKLNAYCSNLY